MSGRRWTMGGYQLKYNPSTDNRNIKETTNPTITANGTVSATNEFFTKDISLTFELYDKPTKLKDRVGAMFTTGTYVSISENKISEELYCLKGIIVDVISKFTGSITRSFSVNLASGSMGVGICHMDDRVGVFYANGTLAICNENGNEISKYTYTDPDIVNIKSIAFDYGNTNNIYGLNRFGKIFKFLVNNGDSSLVYQAPDYVTNASGGINKYKCLHYSKGYFGLSNGTKIMYFDLSFQIRYAVETNLNLVDLTYGVWSDQYHALFLNKINRYDINDCGLDIEKIKSIVANGIIPITDENRRTIYVAVKGMDVDRKRNMQDSRYEINISGSIV